MTTRYRQIREEEHNKMLDKLAKEARGIKHSIAPLTPETKYHYLLITNFDENQQKHISFFKDSFIKEFEKGCGVSLDRNILNKIMPSESIINTEKPKPIDILCPRCSETNTIEGDDIYTCPHCKAEFCVGV